MPSGGIKHRFVSAKPDGADATKVRKSNWNDELDVTNPTAVKADLAITQSDVSGLTAALAAKAATSSLAAIATSGSASDLAAGAVPAARMPAHTGDVTSSAGSVALTIAAAAVSLAKMATLAANSILGNNTGSPATPIALTAAQVKALLAIAPADLTPAPSGGAVNFLRADSTWAPSVASNAGDPNGSVTATQGSIIRDTTNSNLYINTDGVTTWARLLRADLVSNRRLGDGADGAAVFDGAGAVTGFTRSGSVYTATRDTAFTTAVFSNGVSLDMTGTFAQAGFRIFIRDQASVVSGTATIKYNGQPGGAQTGGPGAQTGGAGLGNNVCGCNSASGAGSNQNAGQIGSNATAWSQKCKGGAGGAGGASLTAAGGAGGTVATTYATTLGDIDTWEQALSARIGLQTTAIVHGGGGGGSGAGTPGVAAGGAGGAGGGVGVVGIGVITGTGTLAVQALGGIGDNGAGGNAGGGGGGGGGELFVGYGGASLPAILTLTAAGGAGGTKAGSGTNGSNGSTGTVKFYPLGVS